ncbi:HNH endonuclease [Celerinatantimonas sp. MCCC 1A17872]
MRPNGFIWHHSEIPGRMEFVPFGPHNTINHKGGRSKGLWVHAKR